MLFAGMHPWCQPSGWTRQEIINAVSDHRPVWFTLDFMAEDND